MNRLVNIVTLGICVVAVSMSVRTTTAATLDSSAFTYQYNMDVDPATQDFGPSGVDWANWNGQTTTSTFAGGIMTTQADGNFEYNSQAGSPWTLMSDAAGYTIEMRIKTDPNGGSNGAIGINAGITVGQPNAFLMLYGGTGAEVRWGAGSGYQQILAYVNTSSAFHTYRIAKVGGQDSFSVWIDGSLIQSNLTTGTSSGNNIFQWGSTGGSVYGANQIDYVRFTSGFYAPGAVPEPASLTLLCLGCGLMSFRSRRRDA